MEHSWIQKWCALYKRNFRGEENRLTSEFDEHPEKFIHSEIPDDAISEDNKDILVNELKHLHKIGVYPSCVFDSLISIMLEQGCIDDLKKYDRYVDIKTKYDAVRKYLLSEYPCYFQAKFDLSVNPDIIMKERKQIEEALIRLDHAFEYSDARYRVELFKYRRNNHKHAKYHFPQFIFNFYSDLRSSTKLSKTKIYESISTLVNAVTSAEISVESIKQAIWRYEQDEK